MTTVTNPKDGATFETDLTQIMAVEIVRQIVDKGRFKDNPAVSERTREFAGSLYSSYSRRNALSDVQWYWLRKIAHEHTHQEEKPKPTVESVGEFSGVIALFKTAKEHGLKFPKIRFELPEFGELRLSIAGPRSRNAGDVNVTDGGSFGDNVWYGRVSGNDFIVNSRIPKEDAEFVTRFLRLLAKSPALLSAEYGKMMGHCCFCGRQLTDERSTLVGYGPVCAEHYNLPWGTLPKYTAEQIGEAKSLLESMVLV